jgi:stage II sporulation protein D
MTKYIFLIFFLLGSVSCVPVRSYVSSKTFVTRTSGDAPPSFHVEELSRTIRVAIVVRHLSVKIVVPAQFELDGIGALNSRAVQKGMEKLLSFNLTVQDLQKPEAMMRPVGEGEVEVDGSHYKGTIRLITDNNGTLTVVNELPIEDYVMGVLAGEIPGSWPIEALKAQAIAARTFAVYKQAEAKRKGQPYDLESTASSQMYIGSRLVNQNIQQAVWSTKGEILTYNDQPIMAVFHSNCGGETTGALDVWGRDQPYLKPVSCSFGNHGPHYEWKEEVGISEVTRKLRLAKISIYDIVQISAVDRDDNHRVTKLVLMDGDGSKKTIKGAAFRMALGPDVIRSTRFEAKLEGDKILFGGLGWGHGVGLCQEGACGMAKAGYGAFDILRHYYYGVILDKMKN